ncbi:hypothetical protein LJC33_01065 [Eubacteriales bacterium OttesenSCG-928-N13]|nr:hypothetical protein [Eubacteriales bacterium OttesenSCG-928-N13]
MTQQKINDPLALESLCNKVRELIKNRDFDECKQLICDAMREYPHAPHPHNLMGIILEREDCHIEAMKHFRAAWALDPTYMPARHNLDHYGTFYSKGSCAFDESECKTEAIKAAHIHFDENRVGHITRGGNYGTV